MDKKTVFRLVLTFALILFAAFAVFWAVTELPRRLPDPKAKVGAEPVTITLGSFEGLSMTAEPGSGHSTGVTLVIRNETGYEVMRPHSQAFGVQVLRDGQWYPILQRTDKRANTKIPDIAIFIGAEESEITLGTSWGHRLGRLEPGHYRAVLTFRVCTSDHYDQWPRVTLAAEFDVE